MNRHELVRVFAIATVAVAGPLLSTSIVFADSFPGSVPRPFVVRGIIPKADYKARRRRKNVSAAIPNGPTTAIWNSLGSTKVREIIRRMDRRTPVTAHTLERTVLLLCSSNSA